MKKRIAMIIAFRDFRDEEYFIPKQILESAGAKASTFSSSLGQAIGSQGGEAEVEGTLENLKTDDFDAVLFVGGGGAQKYIDNPLCHRIAKEVVGKDKIVAAICIAPAILAKAGILAGKKATVWNSSMDKSAVKFLKANGAIFQSEDVVCDGKIVTANGPLAAKKFGQVIVGIL